MSREQKKVTIPAGLPGLPGELTGFALVALAEDSPFFFLQSLQDNSIGFILVNPFALFPDYEFDLPCEETDVLGVDGPDQLAVFCIVNASRGFKNATANLLAPVVMNIATGAARQVTLSDKRYSLRHPLPQPKSIAAGEDR